MNLTQTQIDSVEENLREAVREMALNVTSWVFDGNTDEATYRRILTGIEDGDPEILDDLPVLDWSGQWADGPSWENTLSNAMPDGFSVEWAGDDDYDALSDDLWVTIGSEYASDIIEGEVARICRRHLGDD